jgi:hypothetical protein
LFDLIFGHGLIASNENGPSSHLERLEHCDHHTYETYEQDTADGPDKKSTIHGLSPGSASFTPKAEHSEFKAELTLDGTRVQRTARRSDIAQSSSDKAQERFRFRLSHAHHDPAHKTALNERAQDHQEWRAGVPVRTRES